MRTALLIATLFLILAGNSSGQYRINKTIYHPSSYSRMPGDPYNPTVAGIASYFIPGLGQIICSEPGRGLVFLAGYVSCAAFALSIGTIAFENARAEMDDPASQLFLDGAALAYATVIFGLAAIPLVIVDLWALIDAVKVAKVNNLAWRAGNNGMSASLKPFLGTIQHGNGMQVGLRFQVHF